MKPKRCARKLRLMTTCRFRRSRRLKKDKSYAVRRNLLNNESALDALSEEDILELLGEDPGLVEETFGWGCTSPPIAAMLKKRFADSPDPHLREIVAQFEKWGEYQETRSNLRK